MYDFTVSNPIYADGASQIGNGSAMASISQASAVITIGDTGNNHALLRFDTSAIPSNSTVVNSVLKLTSAVTQTPSIGAVIWASEFGTAITTDDYNKAANNTYEGGTTGTLRVQLGTIFAANTAVNANVTNSVTIPSRFIIYDGNSDFEVRASSDATGAPGAGEVVQIHSINAVSDAHKPQLNGYALTDAELRDQNAYRFIAVGAETFVAVGIEGTRGVPVKPDAMLDVTSSTMDGQHENIRSNSLTKQRARPRKLAVGRSGASGDITFELTPEKWMRILTGIMKKVSTTGPDGNGVYTHTFKVGEVSEMKTHTIVQKTGGFRSVFPGSSLSSLSFDLSMDSIITATAAYLARNEFIYDESAAGEDDVYLLASDAAYDSVDNGLLSYIGAIVTFDGTDDGRNAMSATLSLNQNVQEKRGLSRKRSIDDHYYLGFEAMASFEMYFENEDQLRKFLGNTSRDFPFRSEKNLVFQDVEFKFAGPLGSALQEVSIKLPKMNYEAITKGVPGEDAIMLSASGVGLFSSGDESNVIITVKNTEPGTAFDALTDLITVLPPDETTD